ncbi:DNA topoisomerase 4 subunit A [Kaistia sp. 32K]|uniref:DNA topoisomerase IV subunit A n=1 Tax=Kaistia sp. 32K TaxID=2795690 RepID=UPI0019155834|nr:DNA topoisomerase IV subunit A [Kaistia sp. 32K]BCP53336.1 DNA topoisomerase 4 subunit A [Kaistia sp. 32K]
MGKALIPPDGGHVESINLREALEERYLAYALSTIMGRALPDARDGLKPVHRRILYGMHLLRLSPDSAFKKSAKIVGDVMGSFHPHGDQSIYDALVRLAQDFSSRYPLVDGQGNFGNIDGDGAAAYRYTEARMTEVAQMLLEGIDEDAIDFRENYSGDLKEPIVLPSSLPNLLANGTSGIAVGMATSVPPHNIAELCDAALVLIKNPGATTEDLVQHVQGPDLPTGGIIVDTRAQITEAYRTGKGAFRVRARWHVEDQGRGTYLIVVTEIPYQVQKSRLIEKIAELIQTRKVPLLADVRDESAEDIRVVLEPRARTVDAALLMESLFKLTELESRISLNMNVLSKGIVPKVMNLGEVLSEWLEHRREVLVRRSGFRLNQIKHRLEVLEGYLVAYLNLDEVIRIIRYEDEPKQELMKAFSLTDLQAESILNMRLRSLRKLEEFEIRKEHDGLSAEMAQIEALLASEEKQWQTVAWQVKEVRKTFGPETPLGKRRTGFADAPSHDVEDIQQSMIEREPITVVVSEKGWIRALKGHVSDFATLTFKTDDQLKLALHAETTDKLLVFSTGGKFYTLGADKLPGGRGHGEPIRLMVDMDNGQDIVTVFVHKPGRKLLLASTDGRGFVVPETEVIANTRKGKQVLNVDGTEEARICVEAGGDHVAVIGQNRKFLIFPAEQVPEMTRGKGVRLQRYKDGGPSDVRTFNAAEGLTWMDSSGRSYTRTAEELKPWVAERGQAGRLPPDKFPKTNSFGTPQLK